MAEALLSGNPGVYLHRFMRLLRREKELRAKFSDIDVKRIMRKEDGYDIVQGYCINKKMYRGELK